MKLFPTFLSFVCLSLAPIASSQVPTSPSSGGESDLSCPTQGVAVELADCLATVHSAATADAAAGRVAKLCADLVGQGGEETFWGRLHMAYADCYGSPALRQAMEAILPPEGTSSNPEFAESLSLLHDIWQTLEDIRASLDAVQDKAGADAAAETVSTFATHIDDCMKQGDSLPAPQGNRMDLVIYYFSGEYRRTEAVYEAWGALQNRSGDYYGSEALALSMEKLSAAMENLDLPADPYAIGKMVQVCSQMEEVMCRWLDVAATVHDRESADEAASQLLSCTSRLVSIGAGLGQGYEKDLGHVSPRFLFLSLACDRMVQLFIRRNYFDSDALRESVNF